MTRPREDIIAAVAHKAAEIGFTYGALGRDYEYAMRSVDDMLAAMDVEERVRLDELTDHLVHRPYERQLEIERLTSTRHPYTCGLCPWGRSPENHSVSAYEDHMVTAHQGEAHA